MKKYFSFLIKNILYCCVFVSVIFTLTGCNKKSNDITCIKFSSWGSQSELVVINQLLADFEKENPDINVEFLHIPQNYFQKLHLLFASRLEPDVVFVNNIYAPIYIKAGLFENLTYYFDEDFKKDIYFKNAIESFTYENKIYAVPRDVSNLVIYYNKDIFDRQKVGYPDKNWNLFELKKTAKKLTSKNNFGINNETMTLFWLYYLESNGGGILSDDSQKLIIDSSKSIEALQLYSDMINVDHSIPTFSQKASMTSAQMFLQGKLAMYLSGRWMVPKFRESADFNWDVVEFPASMQDKVSIDSSGWAITKNCKNKKAAVRLIKYLSSKESIEMFTNSGLIVPARKDVAYSESFLAPDLKPQNSKAFVEMLNNAKPTPTNENYLKINDILEDKLEPVFNGTQSAKKAINPKLLKEINSLL